jgi:two-component system, LytTR family, response regulator AlgR
MSAIHPVNTFLDNAVDAPLHLRVLVVDDEPLARARLRTLLGDCKNPGVSVVADAAQAVAAMEMLAHERFDVVLLDIHMPGSDGLQLARHIRSLPSPPAVVFVTAHAEHAVQAFELEATDYLTKPVRLERLQAALQKVERTFQLTRGDNVHFPQYGLPNLLLDHLLIQDRGRTERLPLADVLYFKAELKYLTVRTTDRSHILEGTLNELEQRYPAQFLRIHRNALVARHAMRALERFYPQAGAEGETWGVQLRGVDETLAVSRRQLAAVRGVIAGA